MLYFLLLSCLTHLETRNFSPEFQILSPEENAQYNEGEAVFVELTIIDEDLMNGGVTVQWLSDIDGLLTEMIPNQDGSLVLSSMSMSAGTHNTIIIVEDSAQLSRQEFLPININAMPSIPQVTLLPEQPMSGEALMVQALGSVDPEGETVEISYEWLRNNTPYEDVDPNQPDRIPEGVVQKGETWMVAVSASDGSVGTEKIYDAVTIGGSLPEVTEVTITPDTDITTDSLLTCSATAFDVDGDDIEQSYFWKISQNGVLGDVLYDGAALQLSPEIVQPSSLVYCFVEALDSDGVHQESVFVEVNNQQPIVTDMIIEPSSGVRAGVTLICDATVQEPDQQQTERTYRWYRTEASTGTTTLLSLSQDLTLTEENSRKGDTLACELVVEDEMGLSTTQAMSVVVDNTPPVIHSLGMVPTSPTGTDDIECNVLSTDLDGDSINFVYTWTVNGILYPTPTQPELFTESLVAGDEVICSVSVSDIDDVGNSMSGAVTVINTPPVIESVSIGSDAIYTNDTIIANVVWNDADLDIPLLYYTWYVDGVEVKSGFGTTLDGTQDFDKGQEVFAIVYADDGTDESFPMMSNSIIISNSLPSEPVISLGGDYTTFPNELVCEVVTPSVDPDGDEIDYIISWTVDGEPYLGNMDTLVEPNDNILDYFISPGEQWTCHVFASDGEGNSENVDFSTRFTACEVLSFYDIFDNLGDSLYPQECWQIGRGVGLNASAIISLTNPQDDIGWDLLSFGDFSGFPTDDPRVYVSGWDFLGSSEPSTWSDTDFEGVMTSQNSSGVGEEFFLGTHCSNILSWSCTERWLYLKEDSFAVHPGSQNVYLRWIAPLNGECNVDLTLSASEQTRGYYNVDVSTTTYLLQNGVELDTVTLNTYIVDESLTETIQVVGGDLIDIVVSGNSSLAEWTGIAGGLQCTFED